MVTSKIHTEDANLILEEAEFTAKLLKQSAVAPEHILYAILVRPSCAAGQILAGMQKDQGKILATLIGEVESGKQTPSNGLSFSDAASRVLQNAYDEALRCRREEIDSIDLLLGILLLGHSVAWRILGYADIVPKDVRAARRQHEGRREITPAFDYDQLDAQFSEIRATLAAEMLKCQNSNGAPERFFSLNTVLYLINQAQAALFAVGKD